MNPMLAITVVALTLFAQAQAEELSGGSRELLTTLAANLKAAGTCSV